MLTTRTHNTQQQNTVDFEIHNNTFRGSIPASLSNCLNLETITIDSTYITGTVPSELGNLRTLFLFRLTNTEVYGTMPQEICDGKIVDEIIMADCLKESKFSCSCCDKCY